MDNIQSLQSVLDQLYATMLPQCAALIGTAQAVAGFAALWYIAARVWPSIARGVELDFYPLLRPFALGGAIALFPAVIALMNAILQPISDGTGQMYNNANASIATLLQEKQAALQNTQDYRMYVGATGNGDEALWESYTGNTGSGPIDGISNAFQFAMAKAYYNFKNAIKEWLSEVLQVVYEAAALCINTIRTFQLLVLAILGPLVLGFSVFDVFHGSLRVWLAKYVHVFLWLPVANIFGAIIANIQVNMLQLDITQIQAGGTTSFNQIDTGYLIFLIIGIVGYFFVPTVAGYIVYGGGGDGFAARIYRLGTSTVTQIASFTASTTNSSTHNSDKITGK